MKNDTYFVSELKNIRKNIRDLCAGKCVKWKWIFSDKLFWTVRTNWRELPNILCKSFTLKKSWKFENVLKIYWLICVIWAGSSQRTSKKWRSVAANGHSIVRSWGLIRTAQTPNRHNNQHTEKSLKRSELKTSELDLSEKGELSPQLYIFLTDLFYQY